MLLRPGKFFPRWLASQETHGFHACLVEMSGVLVRNSLKEFHDCLVVGFNFQPMNEKKYVQIG